MTLVDSQIDAYWLVFVRGPWSSVIIVAKRCKMGPRLLLITNRKLKTGFQMPLKSLTLDDLEGS